MQRCFTSTQNLFVFAKLPFSSLLPVNPSVMLFVLWVCWFLSVCLHTENKVVLVTTLQTAVHTGFLLVTAKAPFSFISYWYIWTRRLIDGLSDKFSVCFLCAIVNRIINCSVFRCQLLHKHLLHPVWGFAVMQTFQPQPRRQIGGNDKHLKHPQHDSDFQ